jgi:hypothetical protein
MTMIEGAPVITTSAIVMKTCRFSGAMSTIVSAALGKRDVAFKRAT